MAVTDGNRPSRSLSAIAIVLAVLILVPSGILFVRVWQQNADQREATALETDGVEYLAGLSPLISALAEAQSSALQGFTQAPAALTEAVTRLGGIDQRTGERLGVHDRWTNLRDTIGRLPTVKGDQTQIFQAHVEVTALSLALARAVADRTALSSDPDNDVAHLQKAIAIDLPQTVVQASRMGDLSALVAAIKGDATERAQAQAILLPQFGAAVAEVNANVSELTDDLQAAVDDTDSVTLSTSLVSTVDGFRRGVEGFIRGASPNATIAGNGTPNLAGMATAQSQLHNAVFGLVNVVVREMQGMLAARTDRLDNRRLETIIVAAALFLLVAGLIVVTALGRPRVAEWAPEAAPPSGPPGRALSPIDPGLPVPYGAEIGPNLRERSGVVR